MPEHQRYFNETNIDSLMFDNIFNDESLNDTLVTSLISNCNLNDCVELSLLNDNDDDDDDDNDDFDNYFDDFEDNLIISDTPLASSLMFNCNLNNCVESNENQFDFLYNMIPEPIKIKCDLMKYMNNQIKGDSYNHPLLWIYERIDNIANKQSLNIDEPLDRNNLLLYLIEMYKPFDEYLIHINEHNFSDLEYYALHEYLKIYGFTKENVNKFIEIDYNDRTYFQYCRDCANLKYFSKCRNHELKYYNYDLNFLKYLKN